LRLVPEHCLPLPETLAAIQSADIITIGPGSLYTSIVPNMLVRGVAEAIGEATATKVFISNLMTQPGETDNYGFRDHLDTIREYAPQIRFDYAIVNDRPISQHQAELYRADGAYQILLDKKSTSQLNAEIEVVRVDLLDEGDMVRHNTERLARVVMSCAANARERNLMGTELLAAN
jgi:uncharacterized cofD-like protein